MVSSGLYSPRWSRFSAGELEARGHGEIALRQTDSFRIVTAASTSLLLKVWAAFVIASLCMAAAGCHRRTQESPSVLLISIDTLRADHLSCYGYARETSPHLDAFARDAALFENAYVQAPFTLTSHMSIFTSLFPASHDVTEGRS